MPTITPSIKGHLTKLRKANHGNSKATFAAVREYFGRSLPAEQAKHATRKYLASV